MTNFSVFVSNEATVSNGTIGGSISRADTASAGLNITTLKVDSAVNAQAAVASIATAVGLLGTAQGNVGALQNRLQFAIGLARSQSVSNNAAESRIRDANVAEESANLTRYNILTQSGIAALTQANSSSSSVLALLR